MKERIEWKRNDKVEMVLQISVAVAIFAERKHFHAVNEWLCAEPFSLESNICSANLQYMVLARALALAMTLARATFSALMYILPTIRLQNSLISLSLSSFAWDLSFGLKLSRFFIFTIICYVL